MALEAAKCPNCTAQLQLENTMETVYCEYCNSIIIVQEAIQKKKIEIVGNVSLSGISTVENDVQVGRLFLANKEWVKAYEVFCKAIEKKIDCHDAWIGCVAAMTKNFTWADYGWAKLEGSKGILSAIDNSYKSSKPTQTQTFTCDLENLLSQLNQLRKAHT